jgi:hypothetical protein
MSGGVDTVDEPRIVFLDRLTPRQAVVLHHMWGLAADALNGDTLMFDTRIRWISGFLGEMRSSPDGQRQIDQITARVTNLAWQFTPEECNELNVQVQNDLSAEVKCIRCGCSDNRACPGGCSWITKSPPICSRCA